MCVHMCLLTYKFCVVCRWCWVPRNQAPWLSRIEEAALTAEVGQVRWLGILRGVHTGDTAAADELLNELNMIGLLLSSRSGSLLARLHRRRLYIDATSVDEGPASPRSPVTSGSSRATTGGILVSKSQVATPHTTRLFHQVAPCL